MKAALYCRASTEEQGRQAILSGNSLTLHDTTANAHDLGVGEFDDRASGASLNRLGLDALRDVVLPVASTWSLPGIGIGSAASQPTTTSYATNSSSTVRA
jgi:hypothetical protein